MKLLFSENGRLVYKAMMQITLIFQVALRNKLLSDKKRMTDVSCDVPTRVSELLDSTIKEQTGGTFYSKKTYCSIWSMADGPCECIV